MLAFMVGATVRIMIRKLETGEYGLIGECYIHGLMHGEALLGEDITYEDIEPGVLGPA